MKKWLVLCCVLISFSSATLAEETIYKSVDKQGNVSFSGQPQAGAKKMSIPPVQGFQMPTGNQSSTTAETISMNNKIPAITYENIAIIQPQNKQTIWSNAGDITVIVSVTPPISNGDSVILRIDGNKVAESKTQTIFQLKNVDRGTHQLQASIEANGKAIAFSDTITIFIKQASKNMPTRKTGG